MTKRSSKNVSNYSFNGKASTVLAINLSKNGNGDARGSDLLIYHLASEKAQNIGNVADFSFNKAGNYLAYTVDAANQSGNGLYLMNVSANSMQILDSDKASYRSLAWTEKRRGFCRPETRQRQKIQAGQGASHRREKIFPLLK